MMVCQHCGTPPEPMTPDEEADHLAADLIQSRRDTCASVQREADLIQERDELSAFAAALLLAARPLATARGDAEMDRLIAEVPKRARAILGVVERARLLLDETRVAEQSGTGATRRDYAEHYDKMALRDALAALDGKAGS